MDISYELGLRLPSDESVDCETQLKLGDEASRQGYDALLTSETWGYDAFTRLGYLAATTDVTLGTSIVPVHSRTPSLLAQSIGTLAELTGGRTILGIGLSSPAVIKEWHGIEFEPALRRQRETIEIVRQILDNEPLAYDGHIFDIEFDSLRFESASDISLYVAAQGETNVELTGAFADGWIPSYVPLSELDAGREPLVRGARQQDRDPEAIKTIPSVTTCVLEDGEWARERCRETIAFYIGAMGKYHGNVLARHGYETAVEQIRAYWDDGSYDAARDAIDDDLLDEVALAGTPAHAREWLAEREGEIDGLVTVPSTRATTGEIQETIRHVGGVVKES